MKAQLTDFVSPQVFIALISPYRLSISLFPTWEGARWRLPTSYGIWNIYVSNLVFCRRCQYTYVKSKYAVKNFFPLPQWYGGNLDTRINFENQESNLTDSLRSIWNARFRYPSLFCSASEAVQLFLNKTFQKLLCICWFGLYRALWNITLKLEVRVKKESTRNQQTSL